VSSQSRDDVSVRAEAQRPSRAGVTAAQPPLVYLTREAVKAALPAVLDQIDLVEDTYRAMARGRVEMPPKPGVHPRPDAFIHAMPAYLRDRDVAALKWVSGYPENPRRGLPYISGLIVVNEAETGLPRAIMDAGEITAVRTAAASGVCIRALAPDGWSDAAILGFGEQGRYHAHVVAALNPQARIHVYDPRLTPNAESPPGLDAQVHAGARSAVRDAQVIITAGPIIKSPRPVLDSGWIAAGCLLLPVDFDFYLKPELVAAAELFLVDDVGQYEYYRTQGHFAGWPRAQATVGETLESGGRGELVVACNLGVGALDAAFADAVLTAAERAGSGERLTR
jgi:ornithine cyclodeaminase/alanine dehydrogenase-like protein (mu-crystallin family)